MSSVVITSLLAKRDELTQRREMLLQEARTLETDLEAICRTVRLYDPSIISVNTDGSKPRRRKNPSPTSVVRFEPGEFTPLVLTVLREAGSPLTTKDIASAILVAKGGEASESRPETITGRVSATLTHLSGRGRVRRNEVNGDRMPSWEVSN